MRDVMTLLDFELEAIKNGYTLVAGVDEVGRGPLAGPVVCASVIMPLDDLIDGVDDSKKLSEKKRIAFSELIKEKAMAYSICEVDEKRIDEINILNATKECMANAVNSLKQKPEVLFVDALKLDGVDESIKQQSIIKGDAKSYNIACASIIAKVYRDNLMVEYGKHYPEYDFAQNKGYGTKKHIDAIKTYGITPIHRKSFVKNFVE